MFKRRVYERLKHWKASDRRKPLIIRGARQVGKSTLVREFSSEYDHFIELNLERKEDAELFNIGNVTNIMEAILLRENLPGETKNLLLFIDEIQESPEAVQLLRYFHEDLPELHVICAGSLLEHAIGDIPSFPVGRVQQIVLHPFDFEEFLQAKGATLALELLNEIPFKATAHTVLLNLFHEYAIIGGMPEVIKTYINSGSVASTQEVYSEIWDTYKDDIEKYGKNNTEKKVLRHVIETAAHEKDRISFSGFGHSSYKNREVGEAFRSLDKTRLIQLVYPIINTTPPGEVDFTRKPRLQFLDTGLLNHVLGIQSQMMGLTDMNDFYRGRIVQHMVYQQLQAQSHSIDRRIHFWVREKSNSNAEVDLVYPHKQYLVPIEVKSGAKGRLRSLHQFLEKTNHPFAIRVLANKMLLEKNVKTPSGQSYTLLNLPYYLSTRIPQYIEWLSGKGESAVN